MGFTISATRDGAGRATHRQQAADALAQARVMARERWGDVRISTETGDSFTPREFAAALARGRFPPAG